MLAHGDDRVIDLRELLGVSVRPSCFAAPLHGVAAGVAAEDELLGGLADILRPHDLVGPRVLQHPVLMNARFVRERVAPDDGLVRLHRFVGDLREQLARLEQPLGPDARVVGQAILPHAQRHHDLFERRVAGALADAVDRALDLPHAALEWPPDCWRRPARGRRGSAC